MAPSYKKITKTYERTIVVGDIHGCYLELERLLERVCFSADDLLITVGDMVDRGPGTWDVVRFFHETTNAYSVLGNHERRLVGTILGTSKPAWSQEHSLSKLPADKHRYWADFLSSLPAVIESNHSIVTHARIDPTAAIDKQDPYFTCAVGGYRIVIEKDLNDVPLWFYQLGKRLKKTKPICIGHSRYKNIELVPKRLFALDTGAAKGGFLTAVILPECRIVQIASGRNHYEESRQEWSKIKLSRCSPDRIPIRQFFAMKNKESTDKYEKRILNKFELYLQGLPIESTIKSLRKDLIKIIGEVPAPGPERGDYFKSIRDIFSTANHRLINMVLLSSERFNIVRFLKLFEGVDLFTAMEALDTIQKEIKRRNLAEQGAAPDHSDALHGGR